MLPEEWLEKNSPVSAQEVQQGGSLARIITQRVVRGDENQRRICTLANSQIMGILPGVRAVEFFLNPPDALPLRFEYEYVKITLHISGSNYGYVAPVSVLP
ncbi:hypothetical protein OG819_55785 [Streptomyces sp. NBC_01549]|uniref:hypothetical protein n=1 Tax=Streptomyces sp. NBC_01549 TaxID=2975874 RepID=UPI0022572927|nr:hypothetical protein [Streptomyces sp. NBC_01549]MCX4598417.1 hypothetical protein [Streptomyces sp. NBC_01549]